MIDQKRFFKYGMITFIVIAIAQAGNFVLQMKHLNIFSMIIALFQIIFSVLTVGFFYFLHKTLNTTTLAGVQTSDKDIQDLLRQRSRQEYEEGVK